MGKYKRWTAFEVEELRRLYQQRFSLKEMVRSLDRDSGSINKALDRFNIRKHRASTVVNVRPAPRRTYHRELQPVRLPKELWGVKIEAVICTLQAMGFEVSSNKSLQFPYKLNGHEKTAGQLLLECNRIRYAQNLPVFYLLEETRVK